MKRSILLLMLLTGGCVHRAAPTPPPCPCQEQAPAVAGAGWAPAPVEMTPPEKMAPKLRPENCPDDGIHILVNGVCVDTNGK